MKKALLMGVLGLTSVSAYATPEGENFAGWQYVQSTYSDNYISDVNPTAVLGRYGKFVNDNVSIEGRLVIGMGGDSGTVNSYDNEHNLQTFEGTIELDSLMGVYTAGHMEVSDFATIYGIVGYTKGKFTRSAGGLSLGASDNSFSGGFGSNINLGDKISINLEYMQYISESQYDITAIGIGMVINLGSRSVKTASSDGREVF